MLQNQQKDVNSYQFLQQMFRGITPFIVVLGLFVTLTNQNLSPLPPLPDWNDVYDAIIARDLVQLQKLVDQVIRGPWSCRSKYSYLQCLYGRLNAHNLAVVTEFPFSLQNFPYIVPDLQQLHRRINNFIGSQRIQLNQTRELLIDVFEYESQLNFAVSDEQVGVVANALLDSVQTLISFGFEDRNLRSSRYILDDLVFKKRNRTQLDADIRAIELQITGLQARNTEIDGLINRLIQEKNDNNREVENLRRRINDLRNQLSQQQGLQADLQIAEDEITRIENRNRQIDEVIERFLEEENSNKNRINELRNIIRDLNVQLLEQEQFQREIRLTQNEITDLLDRNRQIDSLIERYTQEIDENNIRINTFRLRILDLNARRSERDNFDREIRANQAQLDQIQNRNNQLDGLIQRLTQQRNANNGNIQDLRRIIINLSNQLLETDGIRQDIRNAQIEFQNLLERNSRLDEQFEILFQEKIRNNRDVNNLRSTIRDLNNQIAQRQNDLQTDIRSAEIELQNAVNRNNEIDQNVERLFQERNTNNFNINSLRTRIRELNAQLDEDKNQLRGELQRAEDQLSGISTRNNEIDVLFQTLFQQRNQNNRAINGIRIKLRDLNNELIQKNNEVRDDIREAQLEILDVQRKNNEIDNQIQQFFQEKNINARRSDELRRRIFDLRTQSQQLGQQLDQEIAAVQIQLRTTQTRNSELDGMIARLLSEKDQNNRRIDELRRRLRQINGLIEQQQTQISISIQNFENQLLGIQNRNRGILERVDELIAEKNRNNRRIEELRRTILNINGEIQQSQNQILRNIRAAQAQISDIENKNNQIDRLVNQLTQERDGNNFSISTLRNRINDLLNEFQQQQGQVGFNIAKIRQLIQDEKDDINDIIRELLSEVQDQRRVQLAIVKSVGQITGLETIFQKIEAAQFGCFGSNSQNVIYRGQSIFVTIGKNQFTTYLQKSLGPGAFQTIKFYLPDQDPIEVELVNIFQREWIDRNGNPLVPSVSDPGCCSIESFNFRTGDIISIIGNEIEVVFRTGERMTLTINVCSRVYRVTDRISKILFISQPYGDLNKVIQALLYG